MVDLVIKNGSLVVGDALVEAALIIDQGKIAGLSAGQDLPTARQILDARGKYVLPGLIDAHVHFRDPGLEYKEDFTSGSIAAAYGGITLVLDMPNTKPVTADAEMVRHREKLIASKSFVDVVLVGVITPDNLDQIVPMAKAGVVGYKAYMGESVGSLPVPDDKTLLDAMAQIVTTGLRLGFHAESESLLKYARAKIKASGRQDPMSFVGSRPTIAEVDSIQHVALLAQSTGARIHIFHLSSAAGARTVREWKDKGVDITTETGPHYLFLPAEEYMDKLGARLRVNPPVRSRADGEGLYQALLDGTVEIIATDHAPHSQAEKLTDIWQAMSGFIGVETVIPLMLSEAVNKRGMPLTQLVKLCSENPARVWGIWPRKGSLLPGTDADVTIVDLGPEWTIDEKSLHSKHPISPWDGWQGKGKPTATIIRGKIVMQDGKLTAEHPSGQLIRPLNGTYGRNSTM